MESKVEQTSAVAIHHDNMKVAAKEERGPVEKLRGTWERCLLSTRTARNKVGQGVPAVTDELRERVVIDRSKNMLLHDKNWHRRA